MKATHYGILVIQGVVATYRWQGHVYTVYFSGPVGCVCLGCLHKLTNYVGHLLVIYRPVIDVGERREAP